MHATFDRSEHVAKHTMTFWFRPDQPIRYEAGQFTEIRLPHAGMDSRGDRRWFTLSSSPTEKLVSITTRIDPARPSTFKQSLAALAPGTGVDLAQPMGDFVLPRKTDIPLVFIAAGIGVTPIHSMVKWLQDTAGHRQVHLVYAVPTLEEAPFREVFEAAPITLELVLRKPSPDWPGRTGRLTTDSILELPGVQTNALVYLAGPEPMIEVFYKELRAKGIPGHRLVTDYFPGYQAI
ncbi:MAG TPA: FAD-dependent oxidoreductase [Candidatus Limnocylindria bacterium]|nr:FAD-dependent oxidoreductase [Candidatus Limnocylindria bacterium]